MRLSEEFRQVKAKCEDARHQFISTELDLAVTFAKSALAASKPEKRKRNCDLAREAYSAAWHHLNKPPLNPRKHELEAKFREVTELLESLYNMSRTKTTPDCNSSV